MYCFGWLNDDCVNWRAVSEQLEIEHALSLNLVGKVWMDEWVLVNKYTYSTCVPWLYIDSYSSRVGKENLWSHRNLSLM